MGKTYLTIGDKNYRINLDNSTIKAKDLAAALGPAESLLYTKSADGTYAICTGFKDASEKEKENFIAIANTYEGVPVKSIGAGAFKDCKLTGIKIPNSVESIGGYAFKNCTGLTRVVFRDNLIDIAVVIGNKIFSLQNNFETTVTPNSLISIGNSAFYGCSGLTSIEIPDSVTTISENAFSGCYRLVEVVNKSKHITVEKDASSNGYVGYYALAVYNSDDTFATTKLSNDNSYIIYTDGNEKILVGYDGAETDLVLPSYVNKINQYAFYSCDILTSVEIPNSVTSIGVSAFRNCHSLTNIEIPDSVTSIGKYAFYCCNNFISVIIPNSVTTIGDYAFASCYKLVNVVIGDSVTLIGKNAFESCYQLTSIVIGDSVESIGSYAFNWCYKLVEVINKSTQITITQGDYSYGSVGIRALVVYNSDSGITESQLTNDNGYLIYTDIDSNEKILVNYCGAETDLVLPSYITKINKYALYNDNKLKKVTINSGVTSIGAYAFADCDNLEYVRMSNTVTSVGTNVFSDCSSLTSVIISSKLTSINNYMFNNCDSLTTITIPNKVTSIGNYAFYDCDSLTEIKIPTSVKSIGTNAFESCSNLTSVEIPDSVMSIGEYAFRNCNELTIKCDATQAATNWDKNWNSSNRLVIWNGGSTLSVANNQSLAVAISPGQLKIEIPSNNYGNSPYSCWFQFMPPQSEQSEQYSIEILSNASIKCSLKSGPSSNSLSQVSSQTGTNLSLKWQVDSSKYNYITIEPTSASGAKFTLTIS